MKNTKFFPLMIFLIVLLSVSLACASFGGQTEAPPVEVEPPIAAPVEVPQENPSPEPPVVAGPEIRQWAVSATASSEYGSVDWSAAQATGAPDTPECGDWVTAWASSPSDSIEQIELSFATPVVPTQINIHESYNPNQVTMVEVKDLSGRYVQIFATVPVQKADCPFVLTVNIPNVDFLVNAVRITINQSQLGVGWNEIDAVELVGFGAP